MPLDINDPSQAELLEELNTLILSIMEIDDFTLDKIMDGTLIRHHVKHGKREHIKKIMHTFVENVLDYQSYLNTLQKD